MKPVRLTREAEARLREIARWTAETFGAAQARAYQEQLSQRIDALAAGRPPHPKPCEILMPGRPDAAGLAYCKAGRHFLILRDRPDLIEVLDFVHEKRNLPALIARIAKRGPQA